MSAQLLPASGPGGNNGGLQGTTVGGSKPLHRFIKGEPKIVGIIVLVLGASLIIISSVMTGDNYTQRVRSGIPPGFWLGTLFIISGILYILTAHNPTKKTVTISLALSIVSILGVCWTVLIILPYIEHSHYYHNYDLSDDNITDIDWQQYYQAMGESLVAIFVFYILVGAVIFIVMSAFAGAALRSTKTQTIVVMTAASTETPVE